MGHFILLLLKGIGWILLAILLILVLLVCIALFVPLRYEVEASGKDKVESLKAKVRFSFLLHLISGNAQYEQEQLKWNVRIAWKRLQSEGETATNSEFVTAEKPAEEQTDIEKTSEETVPAQPIEEQVTCASVSEEITRNPIASAEGKADKETDEKENSKQSAKSNKEDETSKKKKVKSETSGKKKAKNETSLFQRLSKKWEEVSGKLKSLTRKKDLIKSFLSSEVHQNAFKKVGKELKRLLLRLKPQKIRGRVDFGFEDPYWTGKTLAWASIFYPFYAESLEVNPHFDDTVIDGQVSVQGKISLCMFVSCGVRLMLNKNIRLTIKHAKKLKMVL